MVGQGFGPAKTAGSRTKGVISAGLLGTTVLVALSVAAPASAADTAKPIAQQTPLTAQTQEVRRRAFSSPGQPLANALLAYSTQYDVQVLVDAAATAGIQAPAVSGNLTAEEALNRLLAGTRIAGRFTDPRTAILAKAGSGGAVALGAIQIEGKALTGGAGAVDGYVAGATRSGTRTDTPLRDVPQAIAVVTQEQMQDLSVQSLGGAIRYVPGVQVHQGEGNRDQVVLRGNSSSADFYLDGARDDVQYFRDLYNTDRVEVLKGPNAMAFGRGGSGGVVNRVSKEADGSRIREATLQGGSFDNKRGSFDVGDTVMDRVAVRLNGVYENSDTFRDYGNIERYGIAPTVTIKPNESTKLRFGYEYLSDYRTADRGIPSFNGRPVDVRPEQYFGNPNLSWSDAEVNSVCGLIEHETSSGIAIRNYTRYSVYDKKYQNVYPGSAVGAAGTLTLSAYNNAIQRTNVTNQTDITGTVPTAFGTHKLLAGIELARQESDAFRNTGFFNNTSTSITVPVGGSVNFTPVTFRQSATDANSNSTVGIGAVYAQDQYEINRWISVIGGARFDSFDLDYLDKRTNTNLSRDDNMVSPRLGLVTKPWEPLSLYASYSKTYLPSAGDQFATLTTATQALKPEEIENYEIGAKWDVRPDLSFTGAIYRLDRQNTRATDPTDPTRFVPTGASRTTGVELTVTGRITPRWQVIGGYAYQDAEIVKTTSAARAGAKVALVPEHTFALWNRYDITEMWGAGVGVIHQSDQFAAVDNTVTLPSFTRIDGAVFFTLSPMWKAQMNVENIFGEKYCPTVDGNNNISPGSPRAFRASVTAKF